MNTDNIISYEWSTTAQIIFFLLLFNVNTMLISSDMDVT